MIYRLVYQIGFRFDLGLILRFISGNTRVESLSHILKAKQMLIRLTASEPMKILSQFETELPKSKSTRLILSLGAAVCSLMVLLPQSAAAENLAEAIAMAYATNPALARERSQQRANDENYVAARSRLGPNLSFGASIDHNSKPSFLAPDSTTSLNLSLNQPLFASGALAAGMDSAKSGVLAGQYGLKSIESNLVLDVISLYTAVRRDQEALYIAEENQRVLKRQLDETRAMFEAGQLTRTDVAQSESRYLASESGLAQAKAQLESNRGAYRALVGQTPTTLEAEPDLKNMPSDFETALSLAEAKNFSLQAALYQEKSAQAQLRAAKSAYGPTISLGSTHSQSSPTDDLGGLHNSGRTVTALNLSVPLFAAGLNASNVRKAHEGAISARESVEEARRTVFSNLTQAWSTMLAAQTATRSNEQQVKYAQIAAEGVRTEQQVGLRTNIEVLNAEQELRSAQLALLDAKRAHYISKAQVLFLTAGLTPESVVDGLEVYDSEANFKKVAKKGSLPWVPLLKSVDGLVK